MDGQTGQIENGGAGTGSGMKMSKTTPATLQNDQTLAAKNARTRYTGGGFAIK
jgi:hypothetical protein